MPFLEKSVFEIHAAEHHKDDDMHVQAISNPEEAAHIAALKLVMNTHLAEKLKLLDSEKKADREYVKTIINQKNIQHIIDDIIHKHAEMNHARTEIHHGVLGRGF